MVLKLGLSQRLLLEHGCFWHTVTPWNAAVRIPHSRHHTTIETGAELRNVGDASYAMSHAAAEAYTVHTSDGCRAWHWRVFSLQHQHIQWPSTGWTCCASCGSSGEAASVTNVPDRETTGCAGCSFLCHSMELVSFIWARGTSGFQAWSQPSH